MLLKANRGDNKIPAVPIVKPITDFNYCFLFHNLIEMVNIIFCKYRHLSCQNIAYELFFSHCATFRHNRKITLPKRNRNMNKIISEILLDDELWAEFYRVSIPGGGILTAEWGSGKIEQVYGEEIIFDRQRGLDDTRDWKSRHNRVRLFTDAQNGITLLQLFAPFAYGFHKYGRVCIDTSRCPSLGYLCCAKIKSLDLSSNANLKGLEIWHSDLRELDLSNNQMLKFIGLHNCDNLHELDLRTCPGLERLDLHSCPSLGTLTLSKKSELNCYCFNYRTALSEESEDKLLETINRNGGRVIKI